SAAEAVLERVSSNDVGLYGYTVADQSACCVYAVAGRRIVRQRGECTGCVPHSFEMLPAGQYAMLEHLRNSRSGLAHRERCENSGICQYQGWRVERSHEILACRYVNRCLATHGRVHHGEQGGGQLNHRY